MNYSEFPNSNSGLWAGCWHCSPLPLQWEQTSLTEWQRAYSSPTHGMIIKSMSQHYRSSVQKSATPSSLLCSTQTPFYFIWLQHGVSFYCYKDSILRSNSNCIIFSKKEDAGTKKKCCFGIWHFLLITSCPCTQVVRKSKQSINKHYYTPT